MCISAAAATVISAIVGAGAAAYSADQSRKAANRQTDAINAQNRLQAEADTRAAQSSNARLAARRRALSQQSLMTGADVLSTGMLNGGKPTLGG